jgi:hypothetical protein
LGKIGGPDMNRQDKELLMQLCELASKENDSAKLLTLIEEINRILVAKKEAVEGNWLSPRKSA